MDDKENESQEDMRLFHYRDAKCNERLEIRMLNPKSILAGGFAVCGLETVRIRGGRQHIKQKTRE